MSREYPILFNGPMVRAILKGRKTKTRRIVKLNASGRAWKGKKNWHCDDPDALLACPYQPGDRLWVRETWHTDESNLTAARSQHEDFMSASPIYFRADPVNDNAGCIWKPSIHLPRWASRITLEVTGVRIERLQDISEEDAKAEGLTTVTKDGNLYKWGIPDRDGWPGTDDDGWPWAKWEVDPRAAFHHLWNGTYQDEKNWDSNPWVWVIDFMMINP